MISFNVDNDTFPKDVEHLPQDIVLCIDRSGSMQTSVEAKDADGKQLEAGFSVQDIVNLPKLSLKLLILNLDLLLLY